MSYLFDKHYTRKQARELLPQITAWLRQLQELNESISKREKRMAGPIAGGADLGGETVNSWIKELAGFQEVMHEFQTRRVQLKDLDRGLIDFPAIISGREVFLCWELGEEDIEYWHDLDAGYIGREPL
jgi:hypothetical protein